MKFCFSALSYVALKQGNFHHEKGCLLQCGMFFAELTRIPE